ncbi:unnamed protein product [Cylicocyclus nassatus]|uniref:BPTI/Kunitz inhibitor domain-containing protein n=1 Tax=Cylicocyclus nassatus TaxID=53992 RepID=A0AA36GVZ9_CYLNA|nr:unnamed protein product [Cylicocyclus nassatus]
MLLALVFAFVCPLYAKIPRRRPFNIINATEADCRLPADLGDFFFDVETKTCFPFKYTGCGGNKNNFVESAQCYWACAKHFNHCQGKDKSFGKCNGSKDKCPNGTICYHNGPSKPNEADCCDKKALDEFKAELFANDEKACGKNKTKSYVGRECSYQFCFESECKQGKYFAYCCH